MFLHNTGFDEDQVSVTDGLADDVDGLETEADDRTVASAAEAETGAIAANQSVTSATSSGTPEATPTTAQEAAQEATSEALTPEASDPEAADSGTATETETAGGDRPNAAGDSATEDSATGGSTASRRGTSAGGRQVVEAEEEDFSEPSGEGETAELVPLNLPIQIPAPAPLVLPEMSAAFSAASVLDLSALKMPPASGNNATEADAAFALAAQQYAATAQIVKQQHSDVYREGNQAIALLANFYSAIANRLPSHFQRADAAIDSGLNQAQASIDARAQDADAAILREYAATVQLLRQTAASGRGAIAANAETAEAQITTIITNLSGRFVAVLAKAATDCETASIAAYDNLQSWQSRIPTMFDPGQSYVEQAHQESNLRAAPQLVHTALTEVGQQAPELIGSLNTDITEVQSSIRTSVGPPLQEHAGKIRRDGNASVTRALRDATTSLKDQTRDARKTIAQMRNDAKAQLIAQRRAARAKLEGGAKRTLVEVHRETRAATQTLAGSLRSSLPHYDASLTRMVDALSQAAASGSQALGQAVPQVSQQTRLAAIKAHRQQIPLLNKTRDGAKDSLNRREQQAMQQADQEATTTMQTLQASADAATPLMMTSAESLTRGFHLLGQGIQQAAQAWSTPLAKAFADYIKQANDILQAQFDGTAGRENAETQTSEAGEPGYQAQIDARKQLFLDWMQRLQDPNTYFARPLTDEWTLVFNDLTRRVRSLGSALSAGIIDRVDEAGVTGALRGVTAAQGNAIRELFSPAGSTSLDKKLLEKLDYGSDDYNAAINYLNGNTAAGALYELQASLHWYNDEESRIEVVMRSLTPDQLRELHRLDANSGTIQEVSSALDGTDLNVFQALNAGNFALADAHRMRDRIDEARRDGNTDALHTILAEYSRAPAPEQYGGQEVNAAARRAAVQRAFAGIQGINLEERAPGETVEQAAARGLFTYATRDIEVTRSAGEGETYTVTLRVEGANGDLARELILHGEQSAEARAARLAVEIQRPGGPNIMNLDTALVDPRLNPNNPVPERVREEARQEREFMLALFAQKYGGGNAAESTSSAQSDLIRQLSGTYGENTTAAELAQRLVTEEHPSVETAALAMRYAVTGAGTNTELIDRTLGRMNRDEIAQMRQTYDAQGDDLYADLGVFGHGILGDLSGDDRLRVERALLGQPRTDRERAEVAAFAVHQQRSETGVVGGWLASGSLQERFLDYDEARLNTLTGGAITFGSDGTPIPIRTGAFDAEGRFTGADSAEFSAATLGAQLSAQNYASKIDQYANFAATSIAVLGAIAAAVASVATGGLASPLLMGAIAGITGLAAMGTQRLISGGRYGWEQAATDLGMTAVQALTAGVGQKLSMLSQAGRLTSNPFVNKVLIGAAMGGLGSLGQTALNDQTWKQGFGHGFAELLAGTFRGVLSGGVTALVSNAIEDMPLGRLQDGGVRTLGGMVGGSTSSLGRGLGKSFSSSSGAFAGRGAELGFESARGAYHGDSGDIFQSMLEAGKDSALQSFGEGAFEAPAHARLLAIQAARMRAGETMPAAIAPEPGRIPPLSAQTDTTPEAGVPRLPTTPTPEVAPEAIATPRSVGVDEADLPARTMPTLEGEATPLSRPVAATPETEPTLRMPQAELPSPTHEVTPRTAPQPEPTAQEQIPVPSESPRPTPAAVTPDDPQPLRPPGTMASSETPSVRPTQPAQEGLEAPRVRGGSEGTAAAVPGAEFRGDASKYPAVQINRVMGAVESLAATTLGRIASIPDGEPHNRVVLQTTNGEAVNVHLSVVDPMPAAADGNIPVARFHYDAASGEYVVQVAARSRPDMVERALAHELAEIRASHRTEAMPDALRPGGHGARPLAEGETPRLSPHDQGRLAELDVLARQISEKQQSGQQQTVARLQDEAERLVAHMGLTGDTEAAVARRTLAAQAMADSPAARSLLDHATTRAGDNPFLQRRPVGLAEDLDLLANRFARAHDLGDKALQEQVIEQARRRLVQEGLVTAGGRQGEGTSTDPTALFRLATQGSEARTALLQEAERLARNNPHLDDKSTPRDPGSLDPHQAEAVRQQFGDRARFQDWSEFRQKFFSTRRSYNASNPEHLAIAFSRWSAGDYIGETGALNSLIASTRKPDTGFEARYVTGQKPAAHPASALDRATSLPTGETVDAAVTARQGLVAERRALGIEFDDPQTTAARQEEIDVRLRELGGQINARSEQLGVAAGRNFARQESDLTEIPIPRSGAGVPDLMFESTTGRLLVVEAKGGESELGVRRSADRTRMVQQGTREYLESLAETMSRPTSPDPIRQLGQRLAAGLLAGTVDYVVVSQPFDISGNPTTPEVGRFNLSPRSQGTGGSTSTTPTADPRSGTASAITNSRFRGDALPESRGTAAHQEAAAAVHQLTVAENPVKQFSELASANPPQEIYVASRHDPNVMVLVRVEVVDQMGALPDGSVPVGRFDQVNPAENNGADYIVRLSARASEGMLERALAHELTEIHRAHGTKEIPDALRPGGFGSASTAGGATPELSAHDHGRLAELDVLVRQIESARIQGDADRVAVLRDETQRLLAQMGMVDNTPAAQARQAIASDALTSSARQLLTHEALAARDHPFLRLPPTDTREYLDYLLDRLSYARKMGDTVREAQVLEQAHARLKFQEGGKVEFTGLDGGIVRYGVAAIEQLASNPSKPRARMLQDMFDFARSNRTKSLSDPVGLDSDLQAAVRRRFADYKRDPNQFQDWQSFRDTYLGVPTFRNPHSPEDLYRALRFWVSGHEANFKGKQPASLVAATRRPDVRAHFEGKKKAVPQPQYRLANQTDVASAIQRTGMSINDIQVARNQAIDDRTPLIDTRKKLQKTLEKTNDPDQRKDIEQQLKDIEQPINQLGGEISDASELLGEAAAIRFGRDRFGAPDDQQTMPRRGSGIPDLMFRVSSDNRFAPSTSPFDPSQHRVVIIEAKGNQGARGSRLSVDKTQMVEQGTLEYLQSLAVEMQRSLALREKGKELAIALAHNPPLVDYYLVRQPLGTNSSLSTPTLGKFEI